jgi:hypothetical protein
MPNEARKPNSETRVEDLPVAQRTLSTMAAMMAKKAEGKTRRHRSAGIWNKSVRHSALFRISGFGLRILALGLILGETKRLISLPVFR